MTGLSAGDYTHRFQGNALDQNLTPYFIGGVGTMTLTQTATGFSISGRQESVAMAIAATLQNFAHATYVLSGSVAQQPGRNIWNADITFTQDVPANAVVMKAQFALVPGGSWDKFWAVSTGSQIVNGPNSVPNEAVTGTITRLPG